MLEKNDWKAKKKTKKTITEQDDDKNASNDKSSNEKYAKIESFRGKHS